MEDPTDLLVIDAIKNQVGLNVEPVIASLDDIQRSWASIRKPARWAGGGARAWVPPTR